MQDPQITTENKFKVGEIVYPTIHPSKKLIVRRYASRIYYCKLQEDPSAEELVYFERELTAV